MHLFNQLLDKNSPSQISMKCVPFKYNISLSIHADMFPCTGENLQFSVVILIMQILNRNNIFKHYDFVNLLSASILKY